MQYQILGLRDFINKNGEAKKYDAFFEKNWRADTLSELFTGTDNLLSKVPSEERFNLYFTAAKCSGKREFAKQEIIPFDIDYIDVTKAKETVSTALKAIGVLWENTASLFSGNGVQFFIQLKTPFEDLNYFDEQKPFYKACCDRINKALKEADLPGEADTTVFSKSRLMRFPKTLNKKPDKPTRMAEMLQPTSVAVDFDLRDAAGIPKISKEEVISKWPTPDTEEVLKGCENIKAMLTDPASVPEPLWYANASIIGHLGGNTGEGRRLWHEYSKHYPKYSAAEADAKLTQAMGASNPRTCANMSSLPGSRCGTCKHFKKIKSPILIIGPDYIRTKNTGFHIIITGADGAPSSLKPQYDDLRKWFEQKHAYLVNQENIKIFTFNGTHFDEYPEQKVKGFAQKWFTKCDARKANEFTHLVHRTNLTTTQWFSETTDGKMNFANGILDISTLKFEKGHTKEHGFMFTLPYDYDPHATAPRFEKFLEEITENDPELIQILKEFGGYALSNDDYWEHKALLLVGNGRNGKNVFLDTLKAIAPKAYSTVAMRHLQDTQHLASFEGKLFNVSDEGSSFAFRETDIFKTLTAGGEIMVKNVYEKPYPIINKAKILIAVNELPPITDRSFGFAQRFSIVPLNAVFTKENRDPMLLTKLKAERAGILNILLAAYHEMKKRGHVIDTKKGAEALDKYLLDNDPILQWFNDANVKILDLKFEDNEYATNAALYTSFKSYCENNNIKPIPASAGFFVRLGKLVKDIDKRRAFRKPSGKSERVLLGITLDEIDNC